RTSLLMAVPLADGTWLNSRVRVRRPPLQWAWPALTSFLLAAVAVGALAWRSVGVVLRPMEALVQAAERLGRGERPAPLALTGPAETQRLADAFNRMADRLTRLLDDRARTLAAIGHDLRSPVTAMRLRVEMVDDAETRERLAACLREIEDLVEAALALSRGTGAEEPWVGTDLRALLTSLIDEMAEAGGTATLDAPEAVTVEIHPAAVRRALRNIVENAVRYGGLARIALRSEPGKARIVIEDDGPGIAREDRERVFEPFMRLEASRSRDTGGAGLGLAIAKAGIEASGGHIELGEATSGGLQVTVCFDQ
ncbi:MAG: ATP-binding protein, partial [Pseudomonadota bacterium]